jgi:phosphohistidine phosphatase
LAVVRELPDELHTVVVVGHNPGLEELISRLTGKEISMPTSAVAVIVLPGSWAAAGDTPATLRTSGRPPAG